MLWDAMMGFLKSWFNYPYLEWNLILIAIGLAIAFAVVWLLGFWPPIFKKVWFWPVLVVSAFLTLLAITFVQIPLQYYIGKALTHFWDSITLMRWLLLAGIPTVLVTGLVQEGAKMVPVVAWWWRSGKNIDPKMGLIIGAIAGAGFGVFEAVWAHNQVFMAGWTWDVVGISLTQGLLPFWDRFWAVAIHIALSALAGYGLAKGRGWQFYLIASFLHALVNYSVLFYQKGMLTENQIEIYIAAVSALTILATYWLRWRESNGEIPAEPVEPGEPEKPAEIET